MATESLINKYRPIAFSEVIGNELAIKALESAVMSPSKPHSYLFTGPSGVGKTTLARIIAKVVDATVEELDAVSNNGVDAMRSIVELSKFQPIMGTNSKIIILDECHALSDKAWQALLKLVEEPPSYLYIALATTEFSKVPDTIKTRCYNVTLKTLKVNEIDDLITTVAELEGWGVNGTVMNGIIQAATGQPRKALTILQAGHSCQTLEELSSVVAEVEYESSSLIELCRFLVSGGRDWGRISGLLVKLEADDDTITQAYRYLTKTMCSGTEEAAKRAWTILDCMTFPRASYDRKTQLVAAVGSLIWGR